MCKCWLYTDDGFINWRSCAEDTTGVDGEETRSEYDWIRWEVDYWFGVNRGNRLCLPKSVVYSVKRRK